MGKILSVFVVLAVIGTGAAAQQAEPQQQQQQQPAEPASRTGAPAGYQPLDPNVPMAPADPNTYIIGPEDTIAVRVWKENEVSAQAIVRPDGKITMPLIGDVMASGRTPQQLKVEITDKLSEFLTRPEVMVSVQQIRSKKYYLTGKVQRTGPVPLVVPTTVLEALSTAGGFQQWAKTKKIRILRDGGSKTIKFNYDEVMKGKNLDQNIYLQNGDIIYVP